MSYNLSVFAFLWHLTIRCHLYRTAYTSLLFLNYFEIFLERRLYAIHLLQWLNSFKKLSEHFDSHGFDFEMVFGFESC